MSPPARSIEELLALARQRRLWPEVESQIAPKEPVGSEDAPRPAPAPTELALALDALRQQAALILGPSVAAAQPLLDNLGELLAADGGADVGAVWAALDELEDQLEALEITARPG